MRHYTTDLRVRVYPGGPDRIGVGAYDAGVADGVMRAADMDGDGDIDLVATVRFEHC